jgi:hypothetical protein
MFGRYFRCPVIVLGFAVAAASSASAAPDDFEVMAARNAPGFEIGAKYDRSATITVPAGGSITLSDRTGGSIRSRTCAGAYTGPIGDCPIASGSARSPVTPGGERRPE